MRLELSRACCFDSKTMEIVRNGLGDQMTQYSWFFHAFRMSTDFKSKHCPPRRLERHLKLMSWSWLDPCAACYHNMPGIPVCPILVSHVRTTLIGRSHRNTRRSPAVMHKSKAIKNTYVTSGLHTLLFPSNDQVSQARLHDAAGTYNKPLRIHLGMADFMQSGWVGFCCCHTAQQSLGSSVPVRYGK